MKRRVHGSIENVFDGCHRAWNIEAWKSINVWLINWLDYDWKKQSETIRIVKCSFYFWKDCGFLIHSISFYIFFFNFFFFFFFLPHSKLQAIWCYWKMSSSVSGTAAATDINELFFIFLYSLSIYLSLFSGSSSFHFLLWKLCIYNPFGFNWTRPSISCVVAIH